MLPMILRIKVKSYDNTQNGERPVSFNLYIPLILAYILLLPAFVIVAVVYAFMLLAPEATEEARGYMRIFFHTPELLIAAKGTEVLVNSDEADVIVYIK